MRLIIDLRNSRGVTLIELIIALALLSMVLAVGYNYYFFENKTYTIGSNQSNVQRDIRLASDFITREVRNAIELELVSSPTIGDGYNYIYLNGLVLMHDSTPKTDPIISQLELKIKKVDNNKNYLEFIIQGNEGEQTYKINTKVQLNNIKGKSQIQNLAIKYKKPNT